MKFGYPGDVFSRGGPKFLGAGAKRGRGDLFLGSKGDPKTIPMPPSPHFQGNWHKVTPKNTHYPIKIRHILTIFLKVTSLVISSVMLGQIMSYLFGNCHFLSIYYFFFDQNMISFKNMIMAGSCVYMST